MGSLDNLVINFVEKLRHNSFHSERCQYFIRKLFENNFISSRNSYLWLNYIQLYAETSKINNIYDKLVFHECKFLVHAGIGKTISLFNVFLKS